MTFTQTPGWTYTTCMAVYFARRPDARLSSDELCDVLQLGTPTVAHINMRGALMAGIVGKETVMHGKAKRTVWVAGPTLRRVLAA